MTALLAISTRYKIRSEAHAENFDALQHLLQMPEDQGTYRQERNDPYTSEKQKQIHKLHLNDLKSVNELKSITLGELLQKSMAKDFDAPGDLYVSLLRMLVSLKEAALYPTDAPGSTYPQINRNWDGLEQDTLVIAERLWRDDFLKDETNDVAKQRLLGKQNANIRAEQRRFDHLVHQSHQMLLLWLEVKLYRLRVDQNFLFRGEFGESVVTTQRLLDQIKDYFNEYRNWLKDWNDEIKAVLKRDYFVNQLGDAKRFKSFRKLFGIGSVKDHDKEPGWSRDATEVGEFLRYQYYDTLMKESRRSRKSLLRAIGLYIYKLTSLFGSNPRRFIDEKTDGSQQRLSTS